MNIDVKRSASWVANKSEAYLAWTTDYTVDNNVVPAYINGNGMGGRFKKPFTIVAKKFKKFSDAGDAQTYPAAGLLSMTAISEGWCVWKKLKHSLSNGKQLKLWVLAMRFIAYLKSLMSQCLLRVK